jgi:hypothetical protein
MVISDEFRHEASSIVNGIYLVFCAYVEHTKQSLDAMCVCFSMNLTKAL